MNPKHNKLAEEVIDFFKKSEKAKLIPGRDLLHLLNENNIAEKVIIPLEKDFKLIESSGKNAFRLTDKGWKFTTFTDLMKELEEEKKQKQIEFEKTKVDLKLAEKMLKEYPKTKWFARIGFFIGLCLAILEVSKWIIQLISQFK